MRRASILIKILTKILQSKLPSPMVRSRNRYRSFCFSMTCFQWHWRHIEVKKKMRVSLSWYHIFSNTIGGIWRSRRRCGLVYFDIIFFQIILEAYWCVTWMRASIPAHKMDKATFWGTMPMENRWKVAKSMPNIQPRRRNPGKYN